MFLIVTNGNNMSPKEDELRINELVNLVIAEAETKKDNHIINLANEIKNLLCTENVSYETFVK